MILKQKSPQQKILVKSPMPCKWYRLPKLGRSEEAARNFQVYAQKVRKAFDGYSAW